MAAGALIWYFVRVGLDDADKLASVIGLFCAVAGLGVAIYGLRARPERQSSEPGAPASGQQGPEPGGSASGQQSPEPGVTASGPRSVAVGGDNTGVISTGDGATTIDMRAEASGEGRVYQAGGDQTINEK